MTAGKQPQDLPIGLHDPSWLTDGERRVDARIRIVTQAHA